MKLSIDDNEKDNNITLSLFLQQPEKENDAKKRASQWGINLDLLK